VNSRGEIILLNYDKITVVFSTGESKDVMLPNLTELSNNFLRLKVDVAVDSNDNVYTVTRFATADKNGSLKHDFVLHAFDENYNIKHISLYWISLMQKNIDL
jgi:hypothetical protein